MNDEFQINRFIEVVARELDCRPEDVERMGRGTFMVISSKIERAEKKTSAQRLDQIRDAALQLTKALDVDEAGIVAYLMAPNEWRSRGADWRSGATLLSWANDLSLAANMAKSSDLWTPYGHQEPTSPKGGRPVSLRPRMLADFLATIFMEFTGKSPTFGTNPVTRHPSTQFARLVFAAFDSVGLRKSWERAARHAANRTNDKTQ